MDALQHNPAIQRPPTSPSLYSQDESGSQRTSRISTVFTKQPEYPQTTHHGISCCEKNDFKAHGNVNQRANSPQSSYHLEKRDLSQVSTAMQEIDKDNMTRNWSCAMLVLAWTISISALAIGARILVTGPMLVPPRFVEKVVAVGINGYPFIKPVNGTGTPNWFAGHRVYVLPEAATVFLTLLLNVALTLILDGINYIPSTTLRWALRREGRLDFNSNPRIFTSAEDFAPNRWYTNVISAFALVIAYGSTSVLAFHVYIMSNTNARGKSIPGEVLGERYALDFNAWGCIGLGIGLLLQSMVATACLANSGEMVLTWNSNPLGTARACALTGDDRSSFPSIKKSSTFDSENTLTPITPNGVYICKPDVRQPSMQKYASQVRLIATIIWCIALMLSVWTIVVGIVAWKNGTTEGEYVTSRLKNDSALSYWQAYGVARIQYARKVWSDRKDWLGLIIQCLVLAVITLGLHFVETITHVARDESIWRKSATIGVNPSRGAVLEGFSNWPCWVLFTFKALSHWLYSYAFTTDIYATMALLPLIALTVSIILLGVLVEFMLRWQPRGTQPATYGDIGRIIALVDEWDHQRIFWGDKDIYTAHVRRAGSAGHRLRDLNPDSWYVNLRAEPALAQF